MIKYVLVFDELMIKQVRKASRNQQIKSRLSKIFDKLEKSGPLAGSLLDSKRFIYEIKSKRPPIRVYFKYNLPTSEIYVFEFELKKNRAQQQKTIERIKFSET